MASSLKLWRRFQPGAHLLVVPPRSSLAPSWIHVAVSFPFHPRASSPGVIPSSAVPRGMHSTPPPVTPSRRSPIFIFSAPVRVIISAIICHRQSESEPPSPDRSCASKTHMNVTVFSHRKHQSLRSESIRHRVDNGRTIAIRMCCDSRPAHRAEVDRSHELFSTTKERQQRSTRRREIRKTFPPSIQ